MLQCLRRVARRRVTPSACSSTTSLPSRSLIIKMSRRYRSLLLNGLRNEYVKEVSGSGACDPGNFGPVQLVLRPRLQNPACSYGSQNPACSYSRSIMEATASIRIGFLHTPTPTTRPQRSQEFHSGTGFLQNPGILLLAP